MPVFVGMIETEDVPKFVQRDAVEVGITLCACLGGRSAEGVELIRGVEEDVSFSEIESPLLWVNVTAMTPVPNLSP